MAPVPCQLCGSVSAPLVRQSQFQWVRCTGCGLAYLDPMPHVHEEAGGAPSIDSAAMGNAYLDVYRRKMDSKMRHTRRRAKFLLRYVKGDTILDIGSNIGAFTENMRRFGKKPVGVEVNRTIMEFARENFPENEFHNGLLEDMDFGGRAFDGIYCSEVIEHVPDVNRFVDCIAGHARPGTALYLTTPHIRQYVTRRPPETWQDFKAPDHKIYFDDANLRTLLERHGFRVLGTRFTFFKGLQVIARFAGASS